MFAAVDIVCFSTMRQMLLFRMMTCLKMKEYSRGTVKALQKYLEKEKVENREFLTFFSVPILENVGILTVFDPSEYTNLQHT